MRTLAALLLLFVATLPLHANKNRGVWFWGHPGNPHGSINIVGTGPLENQTIAFFNTHKVKRCYGSYGTRLIDDEAEIAAWNVKLHSNGIQSQSLMGDNTWFMPGPRASLLTKIEDRLIAFNTAAGRPLNEKFNALHLDIEPWSLDAWKTTHTPADKRADMLGLRDTLAAVRDLFVTEGLPNFPVWVDLAVWLDKLPADGGQVGWLDAADRDQWYADVAAEVTGIVLMAHERDTISSVNSGVNWEMNSITGAQLRVGHLCDVGDTWTDIVEFNNMMEAIEAEYPGRGTDVERYALWRPAVGTTPILAVAAAALKPASAPGGPAICYPNEPGWTHVIYHSGNLCNWAELRRTKSPQAGMTTVPVPMDEARGFFSVIRYQEQR